MKLLEILSEKELEKTIKDGVSLVDFNAPWCAPCRAQEPILKKLADKFRKRALVAGMNIDENIKTASTLGIQSIPTLAIFKNGKEIDRFVGLQSEEVLSKAIENALE